jgi:Multicopper oxidase
VAFVGNCDNDFFCSEYNSTLINGLGRYADGPAVPLAVVNVFFGRRSVSYFIKCLGLLSNFSRYVSYRLRLVSISCDPSFNFSIDSHTLTVIEADGINVQPLVVDSLEIFAGACVDFFDFLVVLIDGKTGQRYSVVVCPFFFSFMGERISSA